jgi:hypothetical protein
MIIRTAFDSHFAKIIVAVFPALILSLCLAVDASAAKSGFSPDFQNYIRLVNERYLGGSLESAIKSPEPRRLDNLAIVLGYSLRVQYTYSRNNPALQQRFENLKREVLFDYLQYIEQVRSGRYPRAAQMRARAQSVFQSGAGYFLDKPNVQAGAMPDIFSLRSAEGLPLAPERQQMKGGEQIDLLNQRPATDANFQRGKQLYNRGVDNWNAGSRAWNSGQKDTAYLYYQKAGQLFGEACKLNFNSGCIGNYHYKQGQFMNHFE